MESKKPTVFVASYEDGIKRVLEHPYAFLMESTMLDYGMNNLISLLKISHHTIFLKPLHLINLMFFFSVFLLVVIYGNKAVQRDCNLTQVGGLLVSK